jgi:hypothetical protein
VRLQGREGADVTSALGRPLGVDTVGAGYPLNTDWCVVEPDATASLPEMGLTLASFAPIGWPDEIEPNAFPRAGVISRGVIQSAMDLLVRRYGLDDREQAFEIMRRVSQIGNVKLRAIASQLLIHDAGLNGIAAPVESRIPRPPRMTFARAGWSAEINRSVVLAELMYVVRDLADAPSRPCRWSNSSTAAY